MPRDILLQAFRSTPRMLPQDAVKLLYQRCFGAGHAIDDPAEALLRLQREYADTPQDAGPLWEGIGGGMCRVRLAALDAHGVSPAALHTLFVEGARAEPAGPAAFRQALHTLQQLAEDGPTRGHAPFSAQACHAYLAAYVAAGCPAVSHSDVYREAYRPAYRVLPVSLAILLPLYSAVGRRLAGHPACILAIDGRCGAGKTSLANLLQKVTACAIIRIDSFYLPPALRTAARLASPGGNIHHERVFREVSAPLAAGQPARYRAYDCAGGAYGPEQVVPPRGLIVIEGSYSLHPACAVPADVSAFLTVSKEQQLARLRLREAPASYARFVSDWIPLEEAYFQAYPVAQAAAYTINTTNEA